MKNDSFYKDTFTLTVSNLTTGVFGFIFSIVLSRSLGAEGMGLYGLIMPIYDLFLCLISAGMVTAVSKVTAVYYSKNDYINLNRTADVVLSMESIWALVVATLVFINAEFICTTLIKDPRAVHAVRAMCPALVFIALSSTLKGYFYGISSIRTPAFIDICEKASRIIIMLSLIKVLSLKTLGETVTGAYLTLTTGEFISLVLLYALFVVKKKRLRSYSFKKEDKIQLLFDILVISFPLCINGFLSTGLNTISTLIIPRRLMAAGFDYASALSLIGKFRGMAFTIIFFPIIVVNSVSTILVPDLSKSSSSGDYWAMESRVNEVVRFAFLLGLGALAICQLIPDSLGMLLYKRNDLGNFIKFISWCAPITYMVVVSYGILNGLGKQKTLLMNSVIASLLEIVLLYVFTGMPQVNIYGVGISSIITAATGLVLNLRAINNVIPLNFSFARITIMLLYALLVFFTLKFLLLLIPANLLGTRCMLVIATGFASMFACNKFVKET